MFEPMIITSVDMGTGFSACIAEVWTSITQVVTTITGQPLLLIPVCLGFAGGVIGLAKGLMGTRRRRR